MLILSPCKYHCLKGIMIMSNRLYEMYKVDSEIHKIIHKLDYLFLSASISQRCYRGVEVLSQYKDFIKKIFVLDYKKFRPSQFEDIYYKYRNFDQLNLVMCEKDDDDVLKINQINIDSNVEIGIDITGFSIPDLFRIIYVLKELKNVHNIHIFYTEPKHYYFKDGLFSTYESLVGERTHTPIPEYFTSGRYDKETLVLFLGFDRMVSKYVHERVVPTDVVAINGFPSYMPKMKDISLINNYELLSTIGNENIFYTNANNPFSAYNTLCDIKNKFSDSLLNICVLGTKPMALGACLFSIDNKNSVKVTYPYPNEYNISASEESACLWYYKISFKD